MAQRTQRRRRTHSRRTQRRRRMHSSTKRGGNPTRVQRIMNHFSKNKHIYVPVVAATGLAYANRNSISGMFSNKSANGQPQPTESLNNVMLQGSSIGSSSSDGRSRASSRQGTITSQNTDGTDVINTDIHEDNTQTGHNAINQPVGLSAKNNNTRKKQVKTINHKKARSQKAALYRKQKNRRNL
jgi:hypothetical protein